MSEVRKRRRKALTPEQREARREANRRWRERNPDKAREANRKYRAKNPDKVREWRLRWNSTRPKPVKRSTAPIDTRAELMKIDIYALAAKSVPGWVAPWDREDVISDIVLQHYEGEIRPDNIRKAVSKACTRYRQQQVNHVEFMEIDSLTVLPEYVDM